MKYALACLIALGLFVALSGDTDAQRKRTSPFSEFHKKAELAVGKSSPVMHLKDIDDNEINLRDYLGRWVFIEFGSYT
ncbi:MAG: hypothetical protein KDB68_15675 [Planctomycetes bacterium]|nr:hypothetical protein [Planctomycetota bacterium]